MLNWSVAERVATLDVASLPLPSSLTTMVLSVGPAASVITARTFGSLCVPATIGRLYSVRHWPAARLNVYVRVPAGVSAALTCVASNDRVPAAAASNTTVKLPAAPVLQAIRSPTDA